MSHRQPRRSSRLVRVRSTRPLAGLEALEARALFSVGASITLQSQLPDPAASASGGDDAAVPVLILAAQDASPGQLAAAAPATDLAAALDSLLAANPNALYTASATDLVTGDGTHFALLNLLSDLTITGSDATLTVRVLDVQLPPTPGAPGLLSLGVTSTTADETDPTTNPTTPDGTLITAINIAYTTTSTPTPNPGTPSDAAHAITTVTVLESEPDSITQSTDTTVIATTAVGEATVAAFSETTVQPRDYGVGYWNPDSLTTLYNDLATPAVTSTDLVAWSDQYVPHTVGVYELVAPAADTDDGAIQDVGNSTKRPDLPPTLTDKQFDDQTKKLREDAFGNPEQAAEDTRKALLTEPFRTEFKNATGVDPADLTKEQLLDILKNPGKVDLDKWSGLHQGQWWKWVPPGPDGVPKYGPPTGDDGFWWTPKGGTSYQGVDFLKPKDSQGFNEQVPGGNELNGFDEKKGEKSIDGIDPGVHVGRGKDGIWLTMPNGDGAPENQQVNIIIWATQTVYFIEVINPVTGQRFSIAVPRQPAVPNPINPPQIAPWGFGNWNVTPIEDLPWDGFFPQLGL